MTQAEQNIDFKPGMIVRLKHDTKHYSAGTTGEVVERPDGGLGVNFGDEAAGQTNLLMDGVNHLVMNLVEPVADPTIGEIYIDRLNELEDMVDTLRHEAEKWRDAALKSQDEMEWFNWWSAVWMHRKVTRTRFRPTISISCVRSLRTLPGCAWKMKLRWPTLRPMRNDMKATGQR